MKTRLTLMLWLVLAWPALAQVVNYPGSASSGSSGPTNGLTQAQVSAAISSGTNTFNGAGIITNAQSATFASTGPFQRIFNITNYGADGSDGVIGQDQYAIQAAIDAANAAGGGIVYMPPGTYYVGPWTYHTNYTSENHPNCIDLTETANITLRGAGKDKSKVAIYPTASVPAIHNIFGAGDTVSVISNRFGATNLVFEDFTIDGAMNWGVATNQQFSFDSTQFYRNTGYPTTFRRMGWINIWEDAIDAQGMVIAIDCTATNIGNQFLGSGEPHIARNCIGWNIGCGLAPLNYYVALETLNPSQSYLTDCKFYGGGGRYHWTGAGVVRNCEFTWTNTPVYESGFIIIDGPSANVNFENCIFNRTTGTPFIFTVLGNAVLTLSGNRFGQYCMALCSTNSRVNVTGNIISSDNGPTILFDGSVYGNVANNQILGAPAANPTILIQGSSTRRSDGLSIVNNAITGHLQFSDTARGTNLVITHNTISDGSIRNYSGSVTNSFYDSNSYRSVAGGGGLMVFAMSPQIVRNNFGFQLYFTSDAGHWPDGDYFDGNVFSGPVSGISAGYIDNGNTNSIWINNRFMTNYASPFEPTFVTITANAALTKYHQSVIFNGSSLTCTLPSAVSVGRGWRVNVKNINSTALTVATVSAQTVDGASPATMAQWVSRTFVSDGANWLTSDPAGGSTTITNTASAAGLVVGGSGSYGIGTNLTSVAGGTNQFWVAASPPNEKYTNRFGNTDEISGAYRVLTVGTNVGNNVQISDGISSFPNGMWIDAGAQEYFVGKISVGTERGQFQLGSGGVSNLTATGVIYAPSNNISGGISAGSLTATTAYVTNAIFLGTITGNGSGLTGVTASNVVGQIQQKFPLFLPNWTKIPNSAHPSILKTNWAGHAYWFAYTPYPPGTTGLTGDAWINGAENPTVLASEDGVNFFEPAGITNPIANPTESALYNYNPSQPSPGDSGGHLSDPELFIRPDNSMICYYRANNGIVANDLVYLVYRTSTNGISWSDPVRALTNSGGGSLLSQQFVRLTNGTVRMFYANGGSMSFRDAGDVWMTNWGGAVACSGAVTPWHHDVQWRTGRELWCIYGTSGGLDPYSNLRLSVSADNGTNWTLISTNIMPRSGAKFDYFGYYKPEFYFVNAGTDGDPIRINLYSDAGQPFAGSTRANEALDFSESLQPLYASDAWKIGLWENLVVGTNIAFTTNAVPTGYRVPITMMWNQGNTNWEFQVHGDGWSDRMTARQFKAIESVNTPKIAFMGQITNAIVMSVQSGNTTGGTLRFYSTNTSSSLIETIVGGDTTGGSAINRGYRIYASSAYPRVYFAWGHSMGSGTDSGAEMQWAADLNNEPLNLALFYANTFAWTGTGVGNGSGITNTPESLVIAASDETTALTTGTGKVTFRMPFAMTVTGVRCSLSTAQTSGSIFTVDINEGGTTILSTKLTVDNTEKTSTTAATAAVVSDTALADDAEITVDIDQVGDGTAKGLKVTILGRR